VHRTVAASSVPLPRANKSDTAAEVPKYVTCLQGGDPQVLRYDVGTGPHQEQAPFCTLRKWQSVGNHRTFRLKRNQINNSRLVTYNKTDEFFFPPVSVC
jgi:hypothetical protein